MKKIKTGWRFTYLSPAIRLKMKLTTILLVLSLFKIQASTYSQTTKITIDMESVKVMDVLQRIESLSKFKFLGNENVIDNQRLVSIHVKKKRIYRILDQLFEGTNVAYKVLGQQIILMKQGRPEVKTITPEPEDAAIQYQINGTVTTTEKEPLMSVSIVIKGTNKGVVSDFDGNYTITVSKGQTLIFSYVGYQSKEILIDENTPQPLVVALEEDTVSLKGVVLTGYRKIKASEFTGSTVKLEPEEIKVGGVATVDKLLQGQAAGVAVQASSSVFGTVPKIRIRGSSSITGINEPLWVLNGVVLQSPVNIPPSDLYSGNARTLLASALGGINPNDIADITILKDATATALYGTKAVNGVIVITTKTAKLNQKLKIDYTLSTTVNLKPSITNFDVLNSANEVELRRELFTIYQARVNDFSANNEGAYSKLLDQQNRRLISDLEFRQGIQRISQNNTDWFQVLFQNSIQKQHSISASFGGGRGSTRTSLSYLGDNGYTLGQNVKRFTFTSASKFFLSDKFSSEVLIRYADRRQRNPNARVNPYRYASLASRAMSPYNEKGELEYYKKHYTDFNIINEIANDHIDINSYDLSLQLQLDYKPIDDITVTLLGNKTTVLSHLRTSTTENSSFANSHRTDNFSIIRQNDRLFRDPDKPTNALPETILPQGGFLEDTNVRTETYTFRGQVNWDVLTSNAQKLNVFAGVEMIKNISNENYHKGYGYIFSAGTPFPDELALKRSVRSNENYYGISPFRKNQFSFYGSLNYTRLNKYIINASLRNDATNLFTTATRDRFLPTWTIAGAWFLHKEPFMQGLNKILPHIKLRSSYGLRGNAGNRGPDLVAYYGNKNRKTYPKFNSLVIRVNEPENATLEFEKEYIFSTGIDFSLFNWVDITAEYYHRENFDLIGFRPVAPSLGYQNKQLNWATMENEGMEFAITSKPVKITSDFSWKGSFNIGYNKNTVISNYIGNDPSIYTAARNNGYPFQGRPLTGLYAFQFASLDHTGRPQYYNSSGNKVYGFISGDKNYGNIAYQGSRDPLYSGGFNTSFTYKGITLGTSMAFNLGHVVRKNSFYRDDSINTLFRDDLNIEGDYRNRWRAPGNENFTTVPRLLDDVDQDFYTGMGVFTRNALVAYNRSDIRTIDASFLRIRTISLQYEFPGKLLEKLGLSYLQTELQLTNPVVFASKKLRGQDPEALLSGTNIPPVKAVTFNLNVGF